MPLPLPRNPAVADSPGARFGFHDGAWIMALGPFCIEVPFQAWVMVCPGGNIHWTYQSFSGVVPVFVMVTSAWYPPDQELVTRMLAVHDGVPAPPDGEGDGDGLGEETGDGLGEETGEALGEGEAGVPPKSTSEQL